MLQGFSEHIHILIICANSMRTSWANSCTEKVLIRHLTLVGVIKDLIMRYLLLVQLFLWATWLHGFLQAYETLNHCKKKLQAECLNLINTWNMWELKCISENPKMCFVKDKIHKKGNELQNSYKVHVTDSDVMWLICVIWLERGEKMSLKKTSHVHIWMFLPSIHTNEQIGVHESITIIVL